MDSNSTDADTFQLTLPAKVIITVVFGSVLFVGITGNVLVIILIILVKKLQSSVNLAFLSLALVDLMVDVFMPIMPINEMYAGDHTVFGTDFCIFIACMERLTIVCSVLTFLLVGVERYTAICYPLTTGRMWTRTRVSLFLVIIWAIAVGVCLPYGFVPRDDYSDVENVTKIYCFLDNTPWFVIYETTVICIFYFLPIPILLFIYGKMILALRAKAPQSSKQESGSKARSQVAWMVIVLLIIFLGSIIPFRTWILIYFYNRDIGFGIVTILTWCTRILLYVNHSANPVVYFVMSKNFREAFCDVFCCLCKRCRRSDSGTEDSGAVKSVSGTLSTLASTSG